MSLNETPHPSSQRRSDGPSPEGRPAEARSWSPRAWGPRLLPAPRRGSSPSRTFRLPGGKKITLATDRVRARPAVTPQISFMLGQNAIGLGLLGLLIPRGLNRFLGITASEEVTRLAFGAREMASGVALFIDPTKASALWARVAGDAFDIAVLGSLSRPENPRRGNARIALGVVLAVTALDVLTAVRMTGVKRTRA